MEKSLQTQLEEIKGADILIGIPSYNNVRSIGHVVRAVTAGLAKYFPGAKAVIFNSDWRIIGVSIPSSEAAQVIKVSLTSANGRPPAPAKMSRKMSAYRS